MLLAIGTASCARPKIAVYPAAEAKLHVGETASVFGTVAQVLSVENRALGPASGADDGNAPMAAAAGALAQILPRRPPTQLLNFGGRYPNETFAAVIFGADAAAVGEVTQYEGKRVTVTGEITLYAGRPQIIVRNSSALVKESEAP